MSNHLGNLSVSYSNPSAKVHKPWNTNLHRQVWLRPSLILLICKICQERKELMTLASCLQLTSKNICENCLLPSWRKSSLALVIVTWEENCKVWWCLLRTSVCDKKQPVLNFAALLPSFVRIFLMQSHLMKLVLHLLLWRAILNSKPNANGKVYAKRNSKNCKIENH